LCSNIIDSEGCKYLKDIKVNKLILSFNKIDSESCEYLKDIKVNTLDISWNKIYSDGIALLEKCNVYHMKSDDDNLNSIIENKTSIIRETLINNPIFCKDICLIIVDYIGI
jgi:hypothetical protein